MSNTTRVAELLEADATGEIKAIYEEIKASNRVPMVALIYRHLATVEGALPWCWRLIGPAMRSGEIPAAARGFAGQPLGASLTALSMKDAAALGLTPMDMAAIRYIITAYNTANPNNLIGARIMQRILAAPEAAGGEGASLSPGAPRPTPFPALPPFVQLEEMPPQLAEKLRGLRTAADDGARGIVPSLYRHLAHWPGYLEATADALGSQFASGAVEAAANKLRDSADQAAVRFAEQLRANDSPRGRPAGDAREAFVKTLDAFAGTIPEMVAVGRLMLQALPGGEVTLPT